MLELLPYLEPMGRVWRFFAAWGLDLLVVASVVASAIGTALREDAERPSGLMLWVEIAALCAVLLTLCGRRRFPFGSPACVWMGCAALSFVDGLLVTSQPGVFLCGMGASVLMGLQRRERLARVGLAIGFLSSAVVTRNDPTTGPANLVFIPAFFFVAWLVGFALRDRVVRSELAEERALRAERERESAARVAVAEERTRMARELHDVVAHAVSVMVLQVGAVRHRMPEGSEEGQALKNVEEAGRTALAEMRRLLGALREGDDLLELRPEPGLGDLQALAGDVRAAGLDVKLHVSGERAALPRSLDLSAYRIVQEGLTNALKHSGARRADVTVEYGAGELRLEVRDDGVGDTERSEPGHGLIGIGERVKAFGGEMSAFVAAAGGFVLRVTLPFENAEGLEGAGA